MKFIYCTFAEDPKQGTRVKYMRQIRNTNKNLSHLGKEYFHIFFDLSGSNNDRFALRNITYQSGNLEITKNSYIMAREILRSRSS